MTTTITITVRFRAGSYVTSSVGGQRASSTMDAATAVESLGKKLLGASFHSATLVDTDKENPTLESTWMIRSFPADATAPQKDKTVQIGPTDV